jgi:putative two-component system response regulator
MSKEEQDDIYKMGLLHDVGKIGVPRKIINKPGRLTDEEFDIMRSHPVKGYEILSRITAMPGISKGARWHHERPDGKGYPDHLKAEDIPFEAKIIAVADSYDAMTSFRSYRGVMPQEAVREQIVKGRGTQFDEKVADAMLVLIDEDRDYLMREPERTGGKASA